MNAEEINKKIQTEKDSFNRNLNRKQQEILNLKRRHLRIISDLNKQKQQATKQNTNESIFVTLNNELEKFL